MKAPSLMTNILFSTCLANIPVFMRTREICLARMKVNGLELFHVPHKVRDEEMCLAAVTQNGNAFKYVFDEQQTEAVCLAAITSRPEEVIPSIPAHLKTKEFYRAVLEIDGNFVKLIPEEFLEEDCAPAGPHP